MAGRVSRGALTALAEALHALKSAEFLYEQALYPVAEYVFRQRSCLPRLRAGNAVRRCRQSHRAGEGAGQRCGAGHDGACGAAGEGK